MLLSHESISHLTGIVTGSLGISPQRNEAQIIKLLNKYTKCESFDEFYSSCDIPNDESKETFYVEQKIRCITGTHKLTSLIEYIFNSHSFIPKAQHNPSDIPYSLEEVAESFNTCMSNKDRHGIHRDNYQLTKVKSKYRVYSIDDSMVDYICLFKEHEIGNYVLINDHTEKCIKKVNQGDYSGAITNARSLLEQILREIEVKRNPSAIGYDGKLMTLMKRVLKLIGLTSDNMPSDIKTIYNQIFGGLSTAIDGFSGMRNCMSDAHCTTYPPNKKEALLAVNTAKTLANFIVEHYFDKYITGQGVNNGTT